MEREGGRRSHGVRTSRQLATSLLAGCTASTSAKAFFPM
jgi:hypothetical protein